MSILWFPPAGDVVFATFSGSSSDEEFAEYLADSRRLLEAARFGGVKYAFVTVATEACLLTSHQRAMASEWLATNAELLRAGCACQALVFNHALNKSVLSAILWMVDYPISVETFDDEAEAVRWARGQLASVAASAATHG